VAPVSAGASWCGPIESKMRGLIPLVTMIANDNRVEFTPRYVVDHRSRRLVKDQLFTRILTAVEGSEGRVGMASMTVQLVQAPTLNVQLSGQPPVRS